MTIVKDTFFGGAEKKAAQAQERGIERQIEESAKGTDEARKQVMALYPAAEESLNKGAQSALDVFGQFLPQQASVFQQGNMGGQQQLAAGLPQIQNALMGGTVDYSQFQPQEIQYDQGIFNQQLPDVQTSNDALNPSAGMSAQQMPQPAPNFGQGALNFFSGGNNGSFGMNNRRLR